MLENAVISYSYATFKLDFHFIVCYTTQIKPGEGLPRCRAFLGAAIQPMRARRHMGNLTDIRPRHCEFCNASYRPKVDSQRFCRKWCRKQALALEGRAARRAWWRAGKPIEPETREEFKRAQAWRADSLEDFDEIEERRA
jgi:hypothetical protein